MPFIAPGRGEPEGIRPHGSAERRPRMDTLELAVEKAISHTAVIHFSHSAALPATRTKVRFTVTSSKQSLRPCTT